MKLWQISSDLLIENVDFSGIPRQYVERLQEYKEHYQEWGAKALREGKHIESVIDCIKHYIKNIGDNRFQELLKSITPHPKNILTLTYDQLKKAQNDYDVKYHSISKREAERLRKKQDLAGFKTDYTEILVKEPGLEIVKFHEGNGSFDNIEEAAKIVTQMSKGTEWCTNGPDAAEHYLEQGPLYLIIINGMKLLCHIETGQLMDVNDNPVELSEDTFQKLSAYVPRIGMFIADTNNEAFEAATSHMSDKQLLDIGKWSDARSQNAPDSIIIQMFENEDFHKHLMSVPYSRLLKVAQMTGNDGQPYGETIFRSELRRAVTYMGSETTQTDECLKVVNLLGPVVSNTTDFTALKESRWYEDPVMKLLEYERSLDQRQSDLSDPHSIWKYNAYEIHDRVKYLSKAKGKLPKIYEVAAKHIADVNYMAEFRDVVNRLLRIDLTDEEIQIYNKVEAEMRVEGRVEEDLAPTII